MAKMQDERNETMADPYPQPEPTPEPLVDATEFARRIARLAAENRSEDVTILDLRGLTSIADFFVIATGTSDRQMRAVADAVEELGDQLGWHRYGISGYDSASWLLADYVDVVIHLFDAQHRHYYDLELLWGDAPRIAWDDTPES